MNLCQKHGRNFTGTHGLSFPALGALSIQGHAMTKGKVSGNDKKQMGDTMASHLLEFLPCGPMGGNSHVVSG